MCWDGSSYWVGNAANKRVYQYDADGIYTGESFAIITINTMRGMTWDGTHFWIADQVGRMYQYDASGVSTGFSFLTSAQTNLSTGICFNGTNLFVNDRTSKKVYEFTQAGTYTGFNFDISLSGSIWDIEWDGTHFWQSDSTNKRFLQYDAAGAFIGEFSVPDNFDQAILFNGSALYSSGGSTPTVDKV
jgi:hypothetical protein